MAQIKVNSTSLPLVCLTINFARQLKFLEILMWQYNIKKWTTMDMQKVVIIGSGYISQDIPDIMASWRGFKADSDWEVKWRTCWQFCSYYTNLFFPRWDEVTGAVEASKTVVNQERLQGQPNELMDPVNRIIQLCWQSYQFVERPPQTSCTTLQASVLSLGYDSIYVCGGELINLILTRLVSRFGR